MEVKPLTDDPKPDCKCGHPIARNGDGLELLEFEDCPCSCHWTDGRPTITDIYRRLTLEVSALNEVLDAYDCTDVTKCNAAERRALADMLEHVTAAVNAMVTATVDTTPHTEPHIEQAIERAVDAETDPEWRRRLVVARGAKNRRETLQAWNLTRRPLS